MIVIASAFESLGAVPLLALSITFVVPVVVDVPEIVAPLKLRPAGKGEAVKMIGVVPVAVIV